MSILQWIPINSLTQFFSYFFTDKTGRENNNGWFHLSLTLTRKKVRQKVRVASTVDYLYIQLKNKQLIDYRISDKPPITGKSTKLIPDHPLVKHTKEEYIHLQVQLTLFLNDHLPREEQTPSEE